MEFKKSVIDISKLENVKTDYSGRITSRCPICALQGQDKKGNHFTIFPDGKFNCIVNKRHNKLIYRMMGNKDLADYIRFPEIKEPKMEIVKEWDLSILSGLIKNYDYWVGRGIDAEACEYFDIGVAIKGQLAGRSVIPIFKEGRKKIVGFSGRKIDNDAPGPKWKHLGKKSNWIFSGNRHLILKTKTIIIVESPACVLKLFSVGITNTICLFGTEINSKIMSYLIKSSPEEILISTNNEPDNNSIGNIAALKIKDKLSTFFDSRKIKVALPESKDFADSTKEQINSWRKQWNL